MRLNDLFKGHDDFQPVQQTANHLKEQMVRTAMVLWHLSHARRKNAECSINNTFESDNYLLACLFVGWFQQIWMKLEWRMCIGPE